MNTNYTTPSCSLRSILIFSHLRLVFVVVFSFWLSHQHPICSVTHALLNKYCTQNVDSSAVMWWKPFLLVLSIFSIEVFLIVCIHFRTPCIVFNIFNILRKLFIWNNDIINILDSKLRTCTYASPFSAKIWTKIATLETVLIRRSFIP
jgi:hypothetical protein